MVFHGDFLGGFQDKIEVVMLTGDNLATATRIAADLGIDKVLADVLPAQKAQKVKDLQATVRRSAWWATASTTPRR